MAHESFAHWKARVHAKGSPAQQRARYAFSQRFAIHEKGVRPSFARKGRRGFARNTGTGVPVEYHQSTQSRRHAASEDIYTAHMKAQEKASADQGALDRWVAAERAARGRKRRRALAKKYPVIVPARVPGGKKTKRRAKHPRQFRLLAARIGRKTVPTRLYQTRTGKLRHPPDWALLGFRSAAAMKKAEAQDSSGAIKAKRASIAADRKHRADLITAVKEGRDPFAPNRRRKAKKAKKMHSKKKIRRGSAKTAARRVRKARSQRKSVISAVKRALAAAKTRFNSNKGKRRSKKSRKGKGKHTRSFAALRRAVRARTRTMKALHHASLIASHRFNDNRRRSRKSRRSRKGRFHRNAGAFATQLLWALKTGAVALGGFAAHRALTNVLDQHVLSQLTFLNDAALLPYRKVIAGLVVAAAGIPLSGKVLPAQAQHISVGMATSALFGVVQAVLDRLDTSGNIKGYLSGYADAGGRASRFAGMGSYYTLPSGRATYRDSMRTGAGEYLQSAQTGLLQAPAGYGALPLLQAAAGMGEYEMVPGYSGMGYVDEGVAPNLAAAEQALNVAEAAAGFGDLSSVTTFNPAQQIVAVPDEPGGSRAGTLAGEQGIFGA